MSKKSFTDDEIAELRSNPFTYAVTAHTLSFTKEFKELFMEKVNAGILPRQILEDSGYSTQILGKTRIWGIAHTIKKQFYSEHGLREGSLPKDGNSSTASTEDSIQNLRTEVEYLRQEVEFLKKISSIRNTGK